MKTNLSMPSAPVIPVIGYPDVISAAEWLEKAFGFETRLRIGAHRAQLVWSSGAIILSRIDDIEAFSCDRFSIMVRIESMAAHIARARSAGATIIREPATFPYGERQYAAVDPWRVEWHFSETIEDVAPEVWGGQRG